jgi:hypothetical protein
MRGAQAARGHGINGFFGVFPTEKRGRVRRKPRRRKPDDPRLLSTIVADAQRQPQEPQAIHALVSELRDHWGARLGTPAADEPVGRLAAASLVAGAYTGWGRRPAARSKAGRAEAESSRLALAAARVLFADLAGDRAQWSRCLDARGRAKGTLSGAALERQRRTLAEDLVLVSAASGE